MIQTKKQYDNLVQALRSLNESPMPPAQAHAPAVAAYVLGDQLFVASDKTPGAPWVPVLREALADGVQRPDAQHAPRSPVDHSKPPMQPPHLPLTVAPSQLHFDHTLNVPAIFHTPTLWDVNYTHYLLDEPHRYHAALMSEAFGSEQSNVNGPPLGYFPLPAEISPAQPFVAQNNTPHFEPRMDLMPKLHSAPDVEPTLQAKRTHKLTRGARRVDPKTGRITHDFTRAVVPRTTFYYKKLVDPETGKSAEPGATNAITRRQFDDRRKRERLVDPTTGKPTTDPNVKTIAFGVFYKGQLVDAHTGKVATQETIDAVPRGKYLNRKNLERIRNRKDKA